MIFVGNDWAEGHHDVYLMDDDGARLEFSRLGEGLEGVARFHEMVAEHASDPAEVVVGIETDRGLWVGALIGAGYQVYAINPMAVSRYRDRHRVGGAKSDRGDAKVIGRPGTHRPSQPSSGGRGQPRSSRDQSPGPHPSDPDLGSDPAQQPGPQRAA